MTADDDAGLARLLDRHVADLFIWLDDYPEDEVDRSAVASIRQSVAPSSEWGLMVGHGF